MTITEYINDLHKEFKTGRATEHSYRGYLQSLIKSIANDVMVTNEPTRVKCGAPDYIITKRDIPIGYIEAKDIGYKLDDKQYKEQFDRYRKSLPNLIITDYIDFWLYIDGELVKKMKIAEVSDGSIKALPEHHNEFTNLIKDFCTHIGLTIKSSKKLAEMMAGKARMLAEVIEKALTSDVTNQEDSTLKDQMKAFKEILIHDITPKGFADVYAQTIAYGMFAARLHDPTLPTFSRQEAAELIPKSNPFLRKLFGYIAGPDIDDRIKWIVDGLVEIFLACNVEEILKNYGKATKMEDPIIHFYETFLSEYDPALRKARGVWYTPQPVVNFIVRAVDDMLKTEFNLPQGLADTSKTKIKVSLQGHNKAIEQEVHKVQILDAATGTGTFLAEVVKHVYKKFEGQQGIWSNYVEQHLLPRLNGFELLMASYAMAHLQLDLLLKETGYKPTKEQRLRVYLTNSLEEHHQDTGTLFANWLSAEANEANQIKRDTPVMCVIGNPPYSGISSNNGEWISKLIEDYKYIDGVHFNERKHWLNDDYVKFIRYGQHFIEKNGSGVLAYINPHGFLDNPTFRGMRWHLLKTFDKIYIIDLHGNSKKKEISPDGSVDQNVFDIMQGVSINLFIKTGNKKNNELGKVYNIDVYGRREDKYDFLTNNRIGDVNFTELELSRPNYLFVNRSNDGELDYMNSFRFDELFLSNVTGVVTMGDSFSVTDSKIELENRLNEFKNSEIKESDLKSTFDLGKNYAKFILDNKNKLQITKDKFVNYNYRPFDYKYTYYDNKILWRWRDNVMKHFLSRDNLGLIIGRQGQVVGSMAWNLCFITNSIIDFNIFYRGGGMLFPLYLNNSSDGQQIIGDFKQPNLNLDLVNKIAEKLILKFTNEKVSTRNTFAPIDILDYIYAVLHSPAYREKYKEFLKIDFPRVPYPTDANKFWQLVKLGGELRQIHLLESDIVNKFITKYPEGGSNKVGKINFRIYDYSETPVGETYPDYLGAVYINETQYFADVPSSVWEFYIGGYQPAQKWLKDRKDRELSFDDIVHYQKIIVALNETVRIMSEIDKHIVL
jgi:predicted helicase